MPLRSRSLLLGLCALLPAAVAPAEDPKNFTIDNPGAARGETPVVFALDRDIPDAFFKLALDPDVPDDFFKLRLPDGPWANGQVFHEGGKAYFAAVLPAIAPGKRSFDLFKISNPLHKLGDSVRADAPYLLNPGVLVKAEGPNVALAVREKTFNRLGEIPIEPLGTLRNDLGPKPILYPLIGPHGVPYTRDYPMKDVPGEDRDHPHHRSFWFTHGKVNGVDFWSEAKGHGTIRQTAIVLQQGGTAVGTLRTRDDWIGPDGAKVCEDERVLRVYATRETHTFDFEVTVKASNGPVTFGDTKEGMFGIRLASSMAVTKKTGGKIVNAEGLTDTQAWGKASPWVDYSGPIGGKTVGVAIFDHPTSFRHPTTWHVRDYGLFAANPFGWTDFGLKKSGEHTIPAGESITFRYRVILHEGDAASAKIADAYRAYAAPPKCEVR